MFFYSAGVSFLHFHLSLLLLADRQWLCDHGIRLPGMSGFSEDFQMPADNCEFSEKQNLMGFKCH